MGWCPRRCLLLSWILLVGCADPKGPDTVPDDSSPAAEAFPCADFAGAPEFQRVHGELDGYVLLPWYDPAGDDGGVVVVDSDGCTRWSADVPPFATAAKWVEDTVWYNRMGEEPALYAADMLSGETEQIDTPDAHHDFLVHPDGTIAWLAEVTEEVDGEQVKGDVIRERAPDGTVTEVWNAFDDLPIEHHAQWEILTPRDWTHANGLAYSASDQSYIVSLYWLRQVIKVDRHTGHHVAKLDGASLADPFGPQHAPSASPGGALRIFDNGRTEGQSRSSPSRTASPST